MGKTMPMKWGESGKRNMCLKERSLNIMVKGPKRNDWQLKEIPNGHPMEYQMKQQKEIKCNQQ